MKDYSVGVETISEETKSVLIGGGYLAQKLALVLHNRGLSCLVISNPNDIDLTTSPEFVFLFSNGGETLPEIVLNFVESVKAKLIIILTDKDSGANAAKQCLSKEIDFCSASIYDLYGGDELGTAIDKIFLSIKNEKLATFKNDQIIVTPIFIDDAVEALCRIAFSTQTFKKSFLITGKEEVPLVGFVNRVAAEAGRMLRIILKPEEQDKPYPETAVRHEKILKRDELYLLFNWRPEVTLAEGIRLALELLKVEKKHPEVKKKMILSP